MTIRWKLTVITLALSLSACKQEIPLRDPASLAVIGHKDPRSGTYTFTSGKIIHATEIASHDFHPGDTRVSLEVAQSNAKRAQGMPEGPPASGDLRTAWANQCCWLFTEGDVGCTGCACTVIWEYCWDNQR